MDFGSFILIEVCRDRKLKLAPSCEKKLTGFFVCLLFFFKSKTPETHQLIFEGRNQI